MIIEGLFQICKKSLNFVVGIWHSFAFRILESKQIRQIKVNTMQYYASRFTPFYEGSRLYYLYA